MGILRNTILVLVITATTVLSLQAQTNETITAFSESYSLEKDGDYAKAIQKIRNIYVETSYAINIRLGWLSYLNGDFMGSISYYKKSIDLMPYSVEARLGLVYPAYAMGNIDQVQAIYLEILEIDPKNYTANYKLAGVYYGKEMYKESFQLLQTIVNLYPFNYNATILYGWVNLKLRNTKEAKILFNTALTISPNDISALEGLSIINQTND